MFFHELKSYAVDNLEKDIQDITAIEEIEDQEIEFNYPSKRATARFNNHINRKSKADYAYEIYSNIIASELHSSRKEKFKQQILKARPSLEELKKEYLKTNSQQETDFLVSQKNYPNLKGVLLTKKQQTALLGILEGSQKYQSTIDQRFY